MDEKFYTFSRYMKKKYNRLSASEEDYLEMIYRMTIEKNDDARVNDLALALNVKPPSVTKMIKKLSNLELLIYEKYGRIKLKPEGRELGKYLLYRHNVVKQFLELIGVKKGLLEETEKIEHTLNHEALEGLIGLIEFFEENKNIKNEYKRFKKEK